MPTPSTTTADSLWDAICAAAEASRSPKKPKPSSPPNADTIALETALLQTLCGGMTHWRDEARVALVHHWRCTVCGGSGTFPNLGPVMVRRSNRAGTQWTTHVEHTISPTLPVEYQHHHHAVSWCHHCVEPSNPNQLHLNLQPINPKHWPNIALRSHHYV